MKIIPIWLVCCIFISADIGLAQTLKPQGGVVATPRNNNHSPALLPNQNATFSAGPGGCTYDGPGSINACFILLNPDPATGTINEAVFNGNPEVVGTDVVDGSVSITCTDSLTFLGKDPEIPGNNLFTLTLSIETTDSSRPLDASGQIDPVTGLPITGIGIFIGDAFPGGTPLTFVDPITVIDSDVNGDGVSDTNVEVLSLDGSLSLTGGPLALALPIFFPSGTAEGVTITFGEGSIADAAGQYIVNITYSTVSDEANCILGDVNEDGLVNLLDVGPFVDAILAGEFVCSADINADGVVDLSDVAPFVSLLSGG